MNERLTGQAEYVRLHGLGDIVGHGEEMAYRERVGDALRCEARNAGKIDRLLGMAKSAARVGEVPGEAVVASVNMAACARLPALVTKGR